MYFYGPHPGIAGASIPIPELIRVIAKKYDGKNCDVQEVVKVLQDAANILIEDGSFTIANVTFEKDFEYIRLNLGEVDGPLHSFCVLKCKEKDDNSNKP